MQNTNFAGLKVSWADLHALAMLLAAVFVVVFRSALPVPIIALVSLFFFVVLHRHECLAIKPLGGFANHLTLARLMLVCVATALLAHSSWQWFLMLMAANVLLDVLDGFTARRLGQVSEFGAALDAEVDAIFVLVVYVYFYLAGVSAAILLPGLLPYLDRLLVRVPGRPVRQRHAVILAGINFVLLLLAIAAPRAIQGKLLAASVLVVSISFLISLLGTIRHQRARTFLQ